MVGSVLTATTARRRARRRRGIFLQFVVGSLRIPRRSIVLIGAACIVLSGCLLTWITSTQRSPENYLSRAHSDPIHIKGLQRLPAAAAAVRATATGDLDGIKRRGHLRVLTVRTHTVTGHGVEEDPQHALIHRFATAHGLQTQWCAVNTRAELAQRLKDGHGDVIIDETPVSVDADPTIVATLPLRSTRYLVVVTAERQARVRTTVDLRDARIGVRDSSPVWEILERIGTGFPDVQFTAVADHESPEQMLARLAGGTLDALIMPAEAAYRVLSSRSQFAVAFDLTGDRSVAWQVRATNPGLRHALNVHLVRNGLLIAEPDSHYGDLPAIKQRRVLRVLMSPDQDNFFLRGGTRAGFEYELAKDFASQQGLRLELHIADAARLASRLNQGRGDLIASRAAIPYVREDARLALSPRLQPPRDDRHHSYGVGTAVARPGGSIGPSCRTAQWPKLPCNRCRSARRRYAYQCRSDGRRMAGFIGVTLAGHRRRGDSG